MKPSDPGVAKGPKRALPSNPPPKPVLEEEDKFAAFMAKLEEEVKVEEDKKGDANLEIEEAQSKEDAAAEEKKSLLAKVKDSFHEQVEKDETLERARLRKLPHWLVYILYCLGKAAFIVVLIYLTYTGVMSDQKTKYLSLDFTSTATGSKTSSYRLCLTVPNALTGTWMLDRNGYWSGFSAYQPALGVYTFQLSDFSKSRSTYYDFMVDVRSHIADIGTQSNLWDPATTLLYWMQWTYVVVDGKNSHTITFAGDARYVFNRFYKTAVLASPTTPCFAIPTIEYDKYEGVFTVSFVYDDYVNTAFSNGIPNGGCCTTAGHSETCVLPPPAFGYNAAFLASTFQFSYSITSLSTALAVNLGIESFDVLDYAMTSLDSPIGCNMLTDTDTPSTTYAQYGQSTPLMAWSDSLAKCVITYGSDLYEIQARIDPIFPNTEPIYCLHRIYSSSDESTYKFKRICLLRMGNAFVYPYFNHMGVSGSAAYSNTDYYNPTLGCECNSTANAPIDGVGGTLYSQGFGNTSTYCNIFDHQHGFIIFNSKYVDIQFYKFIRMASAHTADKINQAVYYPAFAGLRTGGTAGTVGHTSTQGSCPSPSPGGGGGGSGVSGGAPPPPPPAPTVCTLDSPWSFFDLVNYQTVTATHTYALHSTTTSSLTVPVNNIGLFSFCENGDEGCVVYAMNTYDTFDNRLNAAFLDLPYGSCNNAFTIAPIAWSMNVSSDDQVNIDTASGALYVPPSTLVQDYFECYNTIFNSLTLSFGAASGSAGTITPVFVLLIVYLVTSFFRAPPEGSEGKGEGEGGGEGAREGEGEGEKGGASDEGKKEGGGKGKGGGGGGGGGGVGGEAELVAKKGRVRAGGSDFQEVPLQDEDTSTYLADGNGVELPVMRRVVVSKQLPPKSKSANAELRPPQRGNQNGRGPPQADATC